tara:strand:+ start:4668 stop:5408 length:741 start_codon:yes stop_codon:yes gene_type:complete
MDNYVIGTIQENIKLLNYDVQSINSNIPKSIDDLSDVNITSTPADGEVLTYNSATEKFEPQAQSNQSNIINGTGFLKNNGTGTWSYDNNTYLTTAPAPTINSKVFMRLNTFIQTGTGAEQTITNWTPIISEPANLYQGSTNIFSPPRNGHYSINFQTSIKSTTNNSVTAVIKLYQTDIFGTLQLVSHSQEQEANDTAIGQAKYRFLNINIILYLVPTDSLYISTTADGAYELPISPITNLSIHNVD